MDDSPLKYNYWYNDRTQVYLISWAWSDKEDLAYLGYRRITEQQYRTRNN